MKKVGIVFLVGIAIFITKVGMDQNRELVAAEKALAGIPVVESRLDDQRTIAEQALDDIVAQYQEEPQIVIEKEGNKMSAPYDFIPLDDELQIYMEERCNDMEINFFLAAALMESESSFLTSALGDANIGYSVGLFQINNCWWGYMEERGIDVFQPKGNIDAGLLIMKGLMNDYPDDVAAVIQCYKCGKGRGEELMREGIYLNSIEEIVNRAIEWQTKEEN